jgi:alpha-amylase/alpha-mannosidase (GH57 family)
VSSQANGAGRRLPVVVLWHMHQPQYRDALTGEYVLPWTYLHALKDYSDMAAHLEENPAARAVVNFTPVLIEQLQEYAARVASHLRDGTPVRDRVLATLTEAPLPAQAEPRLELLKSLLRAQRQQMIERFEPFAELATLAESLATPERIAWASDQMLWDLAVWYHLAWLGETVRRDDERAQALIRQGRAFAPAQRRKLLGLVAEILQGIVPRYRRLGAEGRAELAVSPYGHPILPLLFDFKAARESQPGAPLPRHASYPGGAERAAWHMAEAVRMFKEAFGVAPAGCWPSEGAISAQSLELIDRYGFRWAATSANVLAGSLGAEATADSFERPWAMPGQKLNVFFRNDILSDAIGFQYANWHGDDAAANLAHEAGRLAELHASDPDRVLLIALDGENAWEHYHHNGYYFLRAMYAALASDPRLELTTLSAALDRAPRAAPLTRVVAGSWVHGTLATWMGDPAKNAGWDLLCDAKVAFDRAVAAGALDAGQLRDAERQLALCESSDWFWWFGDYNPADAVSQFDQLYRRQLANLYRLLRLDPPEALAHPLSVGRGAPEGGGVMRRANAG